MVTGFTRLFGGTFTGMDFLTKPFQAEQVLNAIDAALVRDADLRAQRNNHQATLDGFDVLTPREREVAMLAAHDMLTRYIVRA